MKLRSILILFIFLTLYSLSVSKTVYADFGQGEEYQDELIGMANPAAVYCIEMGYQYRVINEPSGQRGICIFPDGSECDAWAFLQGKCGQSYSYCKKCGYDIKTLSDGKNPLSREYAVCVSKEGNPIGSVVELMSLDKKATEGNVNSGSLQNEGISKQLPSNLQPPLSFDWRNHNGHDFMTPVKEQGACGSCWAFATVGMVEAMHNIWRNNPDLDLDLSEQYLVSDCWDAGNCNGGSPSGALKFITCKGISDEDCFPYIASNAPCSDRCYDWQNRLIKIDSTKYLSEIPLDIAVDEKEYIVGTGPILGSMAMSGYWDGDIYRCDTLFRVHAVIIAGYNDYGGYWIVKNSWGTSFGEDGYFKVGYGECGIGAATHLIIVDELGDGCLIANNTVLDRDIEISLRGLRLIGDSTTLDCNGHMIKGSGDSPVFGIRMTLFKDGYTIKNCTVIDCKFGIDIEYSSHNSIIGNTLSSNEYGIMLWETETFGNHFIDNILINNVADGIIDGGPCGCYSGGGHYFSGNHFVENGGRGIYLDSPFNTLCGNIFADNGVNASEGERCSNNNWNVGETGNYWSDFETNPGYPDSYVISGPGDGVDYYPKPWVGVDEDLDIEESLIPRELSLRQNYPNPFNPTTAIEYTLPRDIWVTITIYNVLGQKVVTLVDEHQSAGYKSIIWDGKNDNREVLSSGIYFYQLKVGDYTSSKKMVLLK